MKKHFVLVFLAGFVWLPPVAAQQKAAGAKPSTVTGCVAQSGAAYRLDQAIVATDQDVDTQSRPGTEANATPKMISYALVGGDLKPHVGHKVEVTGTISSDKPSKAETEIKAAPGMKIVGTLNVKSVKMIAATCP